MRLETRLREFRQAKGLDQAAPGRPGGGAAGDHRPAGEGAVQPLPQAGHGSGPVFEVPVETLFAFREEE